MIARCELQAIDPSLKFISVDKEYLEANWKQFKVDYHVTKASKRALFNSGPPDKFYNVALQTQHKNHTCF